MIQRWKPLVRRACGFLAGLITGAALLLPSVNTAQANTASVATVRLMEGTRHETPMTVIKGSAAGPTVLVVGGLHGDDPSGVAAAKQLADFRDLQKGTLLVIPELNREAVAAGRRYTDVDLNRAFPTRSGQTPSDPRAAAVWDVMRRYNVNYLLDFHEDDRPWTKSGIGNKIIFKPVGNNRSLAQAMIDALNAGVSSSQRWALGGIPIASGLTRAAQDWLGVNSFYISVSRTNSLATRSSQHQKATITLLSSLGMLNAAPGAAPSTPPSSPSQQPQTPPATTGSVTTKTLLPGTKYATTLYIIDSGRPGPTVWISGGIHGSELAGWQAAEQITKWRVGRGKLIVLPRANAPAVNARKRSASGDGDLNREFPQSSGGSPKSQLARAIWNELRLYKPDWVFDLHEAMSNRNLNPNSVGQTIIAYPSSEMMSMSNTLVNHINRSLPSHLRFRVLRYPVQGSLARAAGQFLGANAAIVETSRLYSLQDRIQWHLTLMEAMLRELNMSPATGARSAAAPAAGIRSAA